MVVDPQGQSRATAAATTPDLEELTFLDIARVIHRRRLIVVACLILGMLGGGAASMLTPTAYVAQSAVIALEHQPIIQTWLGSRQAAEVVIVDVGTRLHDPLMPGRWDAATNSWVGGPEPLVAELAEILRGRVNVDPSPTHTNTLIVSVELNDALLARDVAAAYIVGLETLRPQLENLTRSELFDKYYDGSNEQAAQARAERAAQEKTYWLIFDEASTPTSPVRPKPVVNILMGGVLGVVTGVGLVFLIEWLQKNREEFARSDRPM